LREDLPRIARGNGAQPPKLAHHPRQDEQASEAAHNSRDRLRAEIWDGLLGAIGLDLEAASRVQNVDVRAQSAAAWQAIQQLSQGNERLRTHLDEIVDAKAEAVDQMYSELRTAFEGDSERVALLDEVVGDLHRLLRSLLLLPEVGVVREMVERLENAIEYEDGAAVPGETKLLEHLRALEIAIRQIDQGSADGWGRVAQMVQGQGQDEPPTIREMNPVNKTPI
jgi:hypothetical protein